MVYASHLDCYIISTQRRIYRKDVDDKPAYPLMDLNCLDYLGWGLVYSKINRRVLDVAKDSESVSVVNVERKQVDIKFKIFKNRVNSHVSKLRLGGQK